MMAAAEIQFLQKNWAQNRVGLWNDRRGPLTNPVKESASKKHEMMMSSASVDALQPLHAATTKDKIDACPEENLDNKT